MLPCERFAILHIPPLLGIGALIPVHASFVMTISTVLTDYLDRSPSHYEQHVIVQACKSTEHRQHWKVCSLSVIFGLQAMAKEVQALRNHSQQVKQGHFNMPGRRATTAVRMAAHLLRGFL